MFLHVFLHVFIFLSTIFFNANNREIIYSIMDKETLIKLAQPAATLLLAISILSLPIISKADWGSSNSRYRPIYVEIVD